ncbi:restriction endonuclease subunit S [Dyadobacter frigoris]|uniref:Restriction endonuclease subunit S n=1 Tax=Dyadobacter frigoris TaxID=2576211 RepID=A0A4U6DCD0_9BACT|nr:restriction endonuclease subunit S [Dyadobacter frigoris]TKT94151.1 restriction endonuclease subunit S [Dyadobacter frigoris]
MKELNKMTELKEIPSDWKFVKLGEVIEKIIGGGTPFKENEEFWEPEIPWATVKDLKGTILSNTEDFISHKGLKGSSANLIPEYTLIIATRMALGKAVFFNREVAINQDLKAIFPKPELSKYFLSYWFALNSDMILTMGSGSTVKGIRLEVLKSFSFLLPPLPEQQKIATILSTVDEKIEVIDAQITQTRELKKGLMQKLLTRGIGHTKFQDSVLGEIPESWEVSNLESHSHFITKGSTPTTYGFEWQESGITFLRSECVSPNGFILSGAMHISEEANNAMERSKIKGGDILMTITGNVGRTCIYPLEYNEGNINQHIARIRISDSLLLPQFVFQYLSQASIITEYLKITTGQAYPQLSLKQVRETKIPLPSVEEQQKIASILSTVDEKLKTQKEKKTEYQQLKKGLMQQLLTGKVRVLQSELEIA